MPGRSKESSSSGYVIHVSNDSEADSKLKTLGADHLLVLYFSLPWCGSCQKANPSVDSLANQYEDVVFLQVNAEKCSGTTRKYNVSRVPVFLLFANKVRVDRVEGASPGELEMKIRRNLVEMNRQKQALLNAPTKNKTNTIVKMADVTPYLDKPHCRCINDLVPTPFQAFLEGKKLVSGKGVGRMILVYAFTEKMNIAALRLKAPVFSGPKVMRFFVNLSKVLDFAVVSQMSSTNELVLAEEDLTGDHNVEIRPGGLVGVQNLQIYIPETMSKNRRTEIEFLTLIGAPMSMTSYSNIQSPQYSTNSLPATSRGRDHPKEVGTSAMGIQSARTEERAGPSRRRRKVTDHYSYAN